jgi:type IV pilus assembly protein PilW
MLLEWMVGITLGLSVVLGALAATSANLAAAATARDAADLQQRVDGALRMIGEQVRQAGAVRLDALGKTVRFSDRFGGWQDSGAAVSGTEGGPGKPDTLRLSHESGVSNTDCLGNTPFTSPAKTEIVPHIDSEYSVAGDPRDSGRNALYCRGDDAKQSRMPGVDDLQVWFGVSDPDADGGLRYLQANALDVASRVLAVKLCIQASSETRSGPAAALDCNGLPIVGKKLAGRMVRLARGVFRVRHASD